MSARLVGLALLVGLLVGPQRVDARKKRTDAAADAPPADAPKKADEEGSDGSTRPQSANPMANPAANPGDLTRSEFVDLVGGDLGVVNFYAKWCGTSLLAVECLACGASLMLRRLIFTFTACTSLLDVKCLAYVASLTLRRLNTRRSTLMLW